MASHTAGNDRTIPGAETIDMQEGSSHGILLLHGFGDTPQTLSLLASRLHRVGFDVRVPLLPGHGRSIGAFVRSRRSDWIACARDELTRMHSSHRSVSVVGLSMGGALAVILAAENPDIEAIVLMAPYLDMPFTHKVASAFYWAWGPMAGVRPSNSPGSILDPLEREKNLGYRVYSGKLLYELWRLAVQARRALPRVTQPTLILQSRRDPRVTASIAEDALARIAVTEKKLVWVEGGHIITVDYGRENVFGEVIDWITAHER